MESGLHGNLHGRARRLDGTRFSGVARNDNKAANQDTTAAGNRDARSGTRGVPNALEDPEKGTGPAREHDLKDLSLL